MIGTGQGTLKEVFTQAAQQRFKAVLGRSDPRVLAKLEQPYGKDNLRQYFHSVPGLRHVLLPLWKSGCLAGDACAGDSLCEAYYPALVLRDLLEDYGDTPFLPLRGYPPGWEEETTVNETRDWTHGEKGAEK